MKIIPSLPPLGKKMFGASFNSSFHGAEDGSGKECLILVHVVKKNGGMRTFNSLLSSETRTL